MLFSNLKNLYNPYKNALLCGSVQYQGQEPRWNLITLGKKELADLMPCVAWGNLFSLTVYKSLVEVSMQKKSKGN